MSHDQPTGSTAAMQGILRLSWMGLAFAVAMLLGACATPTPYDYTAYKASRPASMLILPPINDTPDVKATTGVMVTATLPLAEAGYYVLPVSLVDETFKQNGMSNPVEIQSLATTKLREIFGADAAVFLRVKEYGTKYQVVVSDTRVTIEGRIVDLRTGQEIWAGKATASSTESDGGNSAGLIGLLVKAVVNQIAGAVMDASFNIGAVSNSRLLGKRPVNMKNGVLYGPRSPEYQKD
jgi:hypothetical protein